MSRFELWCSGERKLRATVGRGGLPDVERKGSACDAGALERLESEYGRFVAGSRGDGVLSDRIAYRRPGAVAPRLCAHTVPTTARWGQAVTH